MSILMGEKRLRFVLVATTFAIANLLSGCGSTPLSGTTTGTFNAIDNGVQKRGSSGLGSGGAALTTASLDDSKARAGAKSSRKIAEQVTAASQPGNVGYKIGPQDMLDFSVFKAPELQRNVQVSESGMVNLPLIGDVPASGKTASELEKDVASRLGKKYLQSPQVAITVREYNSQRVTLEGAVKKPGVYPLRGKTTLLQVVALAEGFTDVGDATVMIFRQYGGQRSAAKFDLADIRSGASSDPVLQAGDTIVAPTSVTKEAFATIMKALPLATFAALAL
jgi:polysaccharide export outer membrane protein